MAALMTETACERRWFARLAKWCAGIAADDCGHQHHQVWATRFSAITNKITATPFIDPRASPVRVHHVDILQSTATTRQHQMPIAPPK